MSAASNHNPSIKDVHASEYSTFLDQKTYIIYLENINA